MKTIKTQVCVSRSTGNSGHRWIIDVMDEISRVQLCRVIMSAEQFALALTAHTVVGVTTEIGDLQYIGCERITTRAHVTLSNIYPNKAARRLQIAAAVAEVAEGLREADGLDWTGRVSDCENYHRVVSRNPDDTTTYTVHFEAFKPAE